MTAPVATFNLSAPISAVSGPIAVGDVVVPIGGVFFKATAANLTAAGVRAQGVALTPWSSSTPGAVAVQNVGFIDAASTNLGAGAASWVRVSAAGVLQRVTTPSGTDDVVGFCSTDGTLSGMFGVLTPTLVNGGGSGFVAPTGTGFMTVGTGSMDAAALAFPLAANKGGTGLAALGSGVATWLGTPSGANFAAATTGTLPVTILAPSGTSTWVLTTTAGVVGWAAAAGGGASAGASTEVQTSNGSGGFVASGVFASLGTLSVGTSPYASSGDVKLGTGFLLRTRNAANSNDLGILTMDGVNNLFVGTDTDASHGVRVVTVEGANSVTLRAGGITTAVLDGTNVAFNQPVIGNSQPWAGMNGMFVKGLATATYTLAASECALSIIKITGTGLNTIKFPAATDATAYMKFVWNTASNSLTVADTNSVAASAALATNFGAWFLFANGAVKQMSAAFTVA